LSFKDPTTLAWLLAALPVLVWGMLRAGTARRRRETLLGGLADALAPGFSAPRRIARDVAAAVALMLLVVALSGPLIGTALRQVQRRGVDVMIVLDTSRSMLAEDIVPSRLERAKREVRGLLENMVGDRVGLVTFAGDARRVCPLTHDATTFRMFLDDIDTTSNSLGGTAVGEGLELALDSFDEEYPSEAVIILLTDGEDHTSDPPPGEIAYEARARGIPIHVVAFGTRDGGTIPVRDARGRFSALKDADGAFVVSRPDTDLLDSISGIADGAYLSAELTPFPLDELYAKRIAVMDGVTRGSATREEGIDRFQWALMAALLFFVTRGVISDRRAAA
jgi:Ca-activated chloride channel family protein